MDRDLDERVPTTVGTISLGDLIARCSVATPGVVVIREVPNGTAETYEVLLARALELGASFERCALVVDLSEVTERPRGRYLEAIRRSIEVPVHLAVTQPGNTFLRVVLRFVLARISAHTSVHATLDNAVGAASAALQGRQAGDRRRG